jgi:hypothetical protein
MDLSNQRGKKTIYKLKRRLCELKQVPRTVQKGKYLFKVEGNHLEQFRL